VSEAQLFARQTSQKRPSLNKQTTTALCLAYDRCHAIAKRRRLQTIANQVTLSRGNFTLSALLSDPIASRASIQQIGTFDTGANPAVCQIAKRLLNSPQKARGENEKDSLESHDAGGARRLHHLRLRGAVSHDSTYHDGKRRSARNAKGWHRCNPDVFERSQT
jgi:hypothetical protein